MKEEKKMKEMKAVRIKEETSEEWGSHRNRKNIPDLSSMISAARFEGLSILRNLNHTAPEFYRENRIDGDRLSNILTDIRVRVNGGDNTPIMRSEEYRQIVESTALVSKTDVDGKIIFANEEFCKVSGYSVQELMGNAHSIVRHPDTPKEVFKELWETISIKKTVWNGTLKNIAKDGSDYYVDAIISPQLDEAGNVVGYIAIRYDITEKAQQKEKLQQERALNKMILDEQTNIVVITTREEGIINVNRAFFDSLPYDDIKSFKENHTCICELFEELNGEGVSLSSKQWFTQVTKEKEPVLHKVKMRNREGELRTFTAISKPVKSKVKSLSKRYFVITLSDITESQKEADDAKHEAQEAQRESYAKSTFLATMSHEIRTPLNGAIGFIDLLSGTQLNTQQKEYIDIIQASTANLLGIINDILDFSKIEAGNFSIENVEFNIGKEIKAVYELFLAKAAEKNIKLHMNIDANVPKYVYGDALRIKQICSNLIGNAIKFTPEHGQVKVIVETASKKNGAVEIKIMVNDTGIGITKETQEHIFSPFSQADNSISRKFGGTGLGLSISQDLAKLMGSQIEFFSEEGKGSVFWVNFTFKISENTEDKEEVVIVHKLYTGARVLVAEDNSINQKLIIAILDKIGIVPTVAGNGREAFNYFKQAQQKQSPYDLIFMDLHMPIMNGIDTAKAIVTYEHNYNLLHTPIVALTADTVKGQEQECLAVGMDAFISKPIDKVKFDIRVSEFLSEFQIEKSETSFIDEQIEINFEILESESINDNKAARVAKELGLDIETAVMAVEDFEKNWKRQIMELAVAIKENDKYSFYDIVHSIKGASGSLYFNEIYDTCLDIEERKKEEENNLSFDYELLKKCS